MRARRGQICCVTASRPTILVTRPQPGANRLARKVRARGFSARIAPLLDLGGTGLPTPSQAAACRSVAGTRARAAVAATPFHALTAFAVGDATARALRRAGFSSVTSADGDGAALTETVLEAIAGGRARGPVLWPRAVDVAFDLAAALEAHGVRCVSWPVYAAREAALPTSVMRGLVAGRFDGVTLTSPRIARGFASQVAAIDLPQATRLLVLSSSIRDSLPPPLRSRCQVAPEPNEDALLSLL